MLSWKSQQNMILLFEFQPIQGALLLFRRILLSRDLISLSPFAPQNPLAYKKHHVVVVN